MYFFCRQVVANQEGSQMSGYLRFKKGRHGMKKAWFVLKNNVLYSYKASSVSGRHTFKDLGCAPLGDLDLDQ